MYEDKFIGPYNEKNELQRMANAILKQKFPVNDQLARLAWNIATEYIHDTTKQEELFAELANLLRRARAKM
jgi:hypothetical protein